jgi:hypothetical protein
MKTPRSVFKNLNGKKFKWVVFESHLVSCCANGKERASKKEVVVSSDIFFSSGATELAMSPVEKKMLLICGSELFVMR